MHWFMALCVIARRRFLGVGRLFNSGILCFLDNHMPFLGGLHAPRPQVIKLECLG